MTDEEMAYVTNYVEAAIGSRQQFTDEQREVWFDLLGDLPKGVVLAACKAVLIDHEYPTIPPVGLVRRKALSLADPPVDGPTAWVQSLSAVRRFGCDRERDGLKSLPPRIAYALRAFGWRSLCDTTDDKLHFAREQFLSLYATTEATAEHRAALPPSVRAVAELAAASMGMPDDGNGRAKVLPMPSRPTATAGGVK